MDLKHSKNPLDIGILKSSTILKLTLDRYQGQKTWDYYFFMKPKAGAQLAIFCICKLIQRSTAKSRPNVSYRYKCLWVLMRI